MPILNSKQTHVLFLVQLCEFQKNKHCLLLIKQYIHLFKKKKNHFQNTWVEYLNCIAKSHTNTEVSKNYSCPLQLQYPLCWYLTIDHKINPIAGQKARDKNGL